MSRNVKENQYDAAYSVISDALSVAQLLQDAKNLRSDDITTTSRVTETRVACPYFDRLFGFLERRHKIYRVCAARKALP